MSEKIVVARKRQFCDICRGPIGAGEICRMVRDDFQCRLVTFEHLRCPGNPAGNGGFPGLETGRNYPPANKYSLA